MHPKLFLIFFLGSTLGEQIASPRSTRTLGSFFGYGGQQQQVQVGREEVKPLVYQVRYYDGKVASQGVGVGVVQGQEKVGVGVDQQVQQQQQGKVHQYYQVAPVGPQVVGTVPGNYVYVQVPIPAPNTQYGSQPVYGHQGQGQGQVQGQGYPFVGQYGVGVGAGYPVPCPVEYVYYYDNKRPGSVVPPVVPTPVQQPGVVQPVSPVTYTNRVRPPQFQPQQGQVGVGVGQGVGVPGQVVQHPHQQQQVPGVPVGPNAVYDYYYNQQPFGYYPQTQPYYPHYYNPVVSPSSDFFYIYQKPGVGEKVVNPQQQVNQQVVTPTEVTKKE